MRLGTLTRSNFDFSLSIFLQKLDERTSRSKILETIDYSVEARSVNFHDPPFSGANQTRELSNLACRVQKRNEIFYRAANRPIGTDKNPTWTVLILSYAIPKEDRKQRNESLAASVSPNVVSRLPSSVPFDHAISRTRSTGFRNPHGDEPIVHMYMYRYIYILISLV